MASFSDAPWSGAASRFKDAAAYCSACLIDNNPPGKSKAQIFCHLPVKEPGGAFNRNAIRAAMAALMGARGGLKGVSAADKRSAATKLAGLAKQAGINVGPALQRMAGMMSSGG